VPYLSAIEVCSRRGAIQIHVYLYLYLYQTPSAHDIWDAVSAETISAVLNGTLNTCVKRGFENVLGNLNQ